LADIGPSALESSTLDELVGNRPLIEALRPLVKADAILLETYSDPLVRNAIRFLKEVAAGETGPEIPILLSLTYHRDSGGELRTITGNPPEAFAWPEIAALGVNCGKEIGMDEILEIVHRYCQVTDVPLFARPNAGTPARLGDHWVYPRSPQDLATRLPDLLEARLAMVGGCCGTTPEHIAAFKPIVDHWNASHALLSPTALRNPSPPMNTDLDLTNAAIRLSLICYVATLGTSTRQP